MALTDRRCHPRWMARGLSAWMFVNDGKPERCRIIDVSRKGVLVKSSTYLRPGTRVELAFARAQGPNVTRLIRRWAQIARSSPKGLAAYFVNPPVGKEARVRRGG